MNSEKSNRLSTYIVCFFAGAIITGAIGTSYYYGLLGRSDKELGEHRERVEQLERENTELRERTEQLIELTERRAELDRRTIETAQGIRRTISELSIQGQGLVQQVRTVIATLKDIAERARLLEELVNSFGSDSSS